MSETPRIAKVGVVAAVLVVLAVAYRFGIFARVADPRRLVEALVAMGPWGYLAFVAAYTARRGVREPERSISRA